MTRQTLKGRQLFSFWICLFFLGLRLLPSQVQARDSHPPRFEGLHGSPRSDIKNLYHLASSFLIYNPVVVEVGAYRGSNTLGLAHKFPYGKVIAFEPNPRVFAELAEKTKDDPRIRIVPLALSNYQGMVELCLEGPLLSALEEPDENASILKPSSKFKKISRDAILSVPCSTLDAWCKENGLDRIDFLQLDASGNEYQILQGAPSILQTVQVIHTKTYFYHYWHGLKLFQDLKYLLKRMGFELLSHWYFEGLYGEAMFVRTEIYDALYR